MISEMLKTEMKEKLILEKEKLESELSRFARQTGSGEYEATFEDIGRDEDENATETEMYIDNKALMESLEAELHEVMDALARVDAGSYGVCRVCGKDIEEGRLKAYPAADDCMEHAK